MNNNIDEQNESIVVVSASLGHDSSSNTDESDSIRVVREQSTTASSSVMTVNEENECFKLEQELRKMRSQLEELKIENILLKQQQKHLDPHAASTKPSTSDQFIDITAYSVAEQIERYLGEADTLFGDNDDGQFKVAMQHLIRKVWSIIAHEYDEKSLERTRTVRDSLLAKLEHTDEVLSFANSVHVLENELDVMRKDSGMLKEKVIKQNEIIKSLLVSLPTTSEETSSQMTSDVKANENPKSETNKDAVSKQEEPKDDDNEGDDDKEVASPSMSPSASFANHLDKLLNGKQRSGEVRSIDNTTLGSTNATMATMNENQQQQHQPQQIKSSDESDDDDQSTLQQQQESSVQQPETAIAAPKPTTTATATNDFLLYPSQVGNYIVVGHTEEIDRKNENILASATSTVEAAALQPQPVLKQSSEVTVVPPPTTIVYQCPKCRTSVDPKEIPWEHLLRHIQVCDAERYDVCMFCLESFPKERNTEFEEHVQSHFDTNF